MSMKHYKKCRGYQCHNNDESEIVPVHVRRTSIECLQTTHNKCHLFGPQNPTPTSTSVRAGNRLTRVSQLHYIRIGSVSLANGRGCARLAHAWGGWVWGAPLVWGGWARPGVSALLVSWSVHWVSS